MAERLTTNAVIEYFEDYELDHMGWFSIALVDEISVEAVMSVMPKFDSQLPVHNGQAEQEHASEQPAGEQEVFEIDEMLLRVSQLFNAGGSARHIL